MQKSFSPERIGQSLQADWNFSSVQVEHARMLYGRNNIIDGNSHRWLELTKNTLLDPMIWFLAGTSILFGILGDAQQSIILLVATIPLIGMDAFLHWRTQASTKTLQSQLATTATVIRNNQVISLPTTEIVPGDLIKVNSGDFFPADGIIISGQHLQADESTLTGESLPVAKSVATEFRNVANEKISVDSIHWGFAGTRLLTGDALLRVVFTGKETLYGEIVESANQTVQSATPLQKSINKLILLLIGFATAICLLLAAVRYHAGFGLIDAILSAATLAVAALPDEFPIVFTFFLSVGVYRLACKKALVRRAVAVENIGRVNCICSDKTGTITEGRLKLVNLIPGNQIETQELLTIATLALRKDSGDPLDQAICDKALENNISILEPLRSFPFTEDRKRETAIMAHGNGEYLVATKGAPETILELCRLSVSERSEWQEKIKGLAVQGYKIIACARIIIQASAMPTVEPIERYQMMGLLVLADPPRKEVYAAIQACKDREIQVLMITGDHPETARAIALQIGLGSKRLEIVTADEAELNLQRHGPQYLQTVDVIARAIPSQKLKFVNGLKALGLIVAVTGDGVNDVPALKAADIGIAMGGAGNTKCSRGGYHCFAR